jgi:hypothetical protein
LHGDACLPRGQPVGGGQWKVHNSIAGNESDMACTLTQKDSDLTRACNSEKDTVNITGKLDGKNVS